MAFKADTSTGVGYGTAGYRCSSGKKTYSSILAEILNEQANT